MSTSVEKVIKRIGIKTKKLPVEGDISFTYIDLWGDEERGKLKWNKDADIEISFYSTKLNKKYEAKFNAEERNSHSKIIREFKEDCLGKAPKFSWINQENKNSEIKKTIKNKGP